MSPSIIDSSRIAESSKKRATIIPVCLWGLCTQVTKLPRMSYATSATKYYQIVLLPAKLTDIHATYKDKILVFFMPKLKTSTNSQSLIVKSSKMVKNMPKGSCRVRYCTELKEEAHHFTQTGRF
jgi:hypothetical protein